MPKGNNRPIFLNLARIRQPITALISITHRVAGILLFFSLPFVIYLLDMSLSSMRGYLQAQAILAHGAVKLLCTLVLWALAYHMFAGVRILFIDLGFGVDRAEAHRSAWVVVVGAVIAFALIGGAMLW